MSTQSDRSEQVIENYKKRKLAVNAMRRIHDLIEGFERDRVIDRRIARYGLLVLALVVGVSLYFFFTGDSITLR